MTNGQEITGPTYTDGCKVHGGDCKKEYSFGRSSVHVFTACKCAELHGDGFKQYFTSYTDASNKARMMLAHSKVW